MSQCYIDKYSLLGYVDVIVPGKIFVFQWYSVHFDNFDSVQLNSNQFDAVQFNTCGGNFLWHQK